MKTKILLISALSLFGFSSMAQTTKEVKLSKKNKVGEVYWGINMDSYLLTAANLDKGNGSEITTPRFTMFPHIGTTAHYDFTNHFGLVSGLQIKNNGFIEKFKTASNADSTFTRRVYTIGIPLAVKIGNMSGTYFMIGGGVDIPFHYKEKGFIKRGNKSHKESEWFSQRTATVMPYASIGARFNPFLFVKAVYYPGNFMNTKYTEVVSTPAGVTNTLPYKDYSVNQFMLSVGFDLTYRPKYD